MVVKRGSTVAAAERGRKVMVSIDSSFEVADHDFTRFSIVPSVSFFIDTKLLFLRRRKR